MKKRFMYIIYFLFLFTLISAKGIINVSAALTDEQCKVATTSQVCQNGSLKQDCIWYNNQCLSKTTVDKLIMTNDKTVIDKNKNEDIISVQNFCENLDVDKCENYTKKYGCVLSNKTSCVWSAVVNFSESKVDPDDILDLGPRCEAKVNGISPNQETCEAKNKEKIFIDNDIICYYDVLSNSCKKWLGDKDATICSQYTSEKKCWKSGSCHYIDNACKLGVNEAHNYNDCKKYSDNKEACNATLNCSYEGSSKSCNYVENNKDNKNYVDIEYSSGCGILGPRTQKRLKWLYNALRVLAPTLLIIFSITGFLGAVFSGEEKNLETAKRNFAIRLVITAILILAPFVIKFFINLAEISLGVEDVFCGILG